MQAGFPRQLALLTAVPSISQKGGMAATSIKTAYLMESWITNAFLKKMPHFPKSSEHTET